MTCRLYQFCDSKIGQQAVAVGIDEDIPRLEVAVNHISLMGIMECSGYLNYMRTGSIYKHIVPASNGGLQVLLEIYIMARVYGYYCPVAHALGVTGEKWALLIVRDLLDEPKRFTDVLTRLGNITPK